MTLRHAGRVDPMWKKHTESMSQLIKWGEFVLRESVICCNTSGWINYLLWKLNDSGKTDKPANLCMSPLRQPDAAGQWYCGTFISRTEILHNMPPSILRHAGYKKNRVYTMRSFSARSEARKQCEIFQASRCIVFHTDTRLCFRDFSFLFLSASIVSQQAKSGSLCWLSLAPCLSASLMPDER